MNPSFTPGPWIVCIADDDPEKAYLVFAASSLRNGRIAARELDNYVAMAGLNHVNYSANARLIAAAPEMLDAMQRCYRMLLTEPDVKGALFKAENILRDTIAQATGVAA